MADPPPPSYDEAITGDFSAPPSPGTDPLLHSEGVRESNGQYNEGRTNNFNNLCISDSYEDGANPSAGSSSSKVCKKLLAFSIVVLGVFMATLLFLVVSSNQSGDTCPEISCSNEDNMKMCLFECINGHFMHVHTYNGYPEKEFRPPRYTCLKFGCVHYYPNFQCLPPSKYTQDCELKDLTTEDSGPIPLELSNCPHNFKQNISNSAVTVLCGF